MELGTIDTLEFDTTKGSWPTLVHVSGDVYAIAYSGGPGSGVLSGYGWLITVSIDSDGYISSIIDSFNFDASSCYRAAHIIHISGNVYAIAYHKTNSGGWVITVEIDSAGNITKSVIDSLQLFSRIGTLDPLPFIIHAYGDIYIILSSNASNAEGYLYTVDIDSAGNIGPAVIDSYRYDANAGDYPEIMKVFGTTYVIVCAGHWLRTLTIANDGTIAVDPTIDSLDFDPPVSELAYGVSLVHVSGDVYAIAYNGVDGDGFLKTVDIDSAGNIGAVVDTLEFDTRAGTWPHIIPMSGDIYAIAYTSSGLDGYVKTVAIESDGTIGSVIKSFRFSGTGESTFILTITSTRVAVAYSGYGSDGYLETIGEVTLAAITTNPATSIRIPSATLNGTLDDDGGQACSCNFEWGETEQYGNTTSIQSKRTGETFSANISGLTPCRLYHFRAKAVNVDGTSYGSHRCFLVAQGNPNIDQLIYQHVERLGI